MSFKLSEVSAATEFTTDPGVVVAAPQGRSVRGGKTLDPVVRDCWRASEAPDAPELPVKLEWFCFPAGVRLLRVVSGWPAAALPSGLSALPALQALSLRGCGGDGRLGRRLLADLRRLLGGDLAVPGAARARLLLDCC